MFLAQSLECALALLICPYFVSFFSLCALIREQLVICLFIKQPTCSFSYTSAHTPCAKRCGKVASLSLDHLTTCLFLLSNNCCTHLLIIPTTLAQHQSHFLQCNKTLCRIVFFLKVVLNLKHHLLLYYKLMKIVTNIFLN